MKTEITGIVPAQPGFYVATPLFDGDKICGFHEMPVVAWEILTTTWAADDENEEERRSEAKPVVPEEWLKCYSYFIKLPNGTYDEPNARFGMTEDEAIEQAQANYDEEIGRKGAA